MSCWSNVWNDEMHVTRSDQCISRQSRKNNVGYIAFSTQSHRRKKRFCCCAASNCLKIRRVGTIGHVLHVCWGECLIHSRWDEPVAAWMLPTSSSKTCLSRRWGRSFLPALTEIPYYILAQQLGKLPFTCWRQQSKDATGHPFGSGSDQVSKWNTIITSSSIRPVLLNSWMLSFHTSFFLYHFSVQRCAKFVLIFISIDVTIFFSWSLAR